MHPVTPLHPSEPKRPDPAEALRRSGLFSGATDASLDALAEQARSRIWAEGRTIFQRGDTDTFLVAILSGRVRLALSTARGRELVLKHLGPGEVIGEFALIDGEPRSADAIAVTEVRGIVLERQAFLRVAETRPDLGLALARHLCGLLRSTNFQMESIALYDLQMRVARFLQLSLRDAPDAADQPTVPVRWGLNQGELALIVGASRPKVNQVIQSFIADGILIRQGNAILCVRAALEDYIEAYDMGME